MREGRRFTLDGSHELEAHLAITCDHVLTGIRDLIPNGNLEALLLGGGYGRGEGGVLKTKSGDRPYNDLEFYVLLRGSCWVNERKYLGAFHALAERISPEAGLEIEFKILSFRKLQRTPPSMFFYDLLTGHRDFLGRKDLTLNCDHHLVAKNIPLCEATRLLMNRCSGLLFAQEQLQREPFTAENADFVGRNHAKAQLAFGDVVLAAHGQYHSSCRERHERLQKFLSLENLPWLEQVRRHHCLGVEFKLHPRQQQNARQEFFEQQAALSALGLQLWLWLERRRLQRSFSSARDYATSTSNKCPEQPPSRNLLVNAKTFGPAAVLQKNATRYPRERIFHALALLLWEPETLRHAVLLQRVQEELRSRATNFSGLVGAYATLWRRFN